LWRWEVAGGVENAKGELRAEVRGGVALIVHGDGLL
jgi:hypothetical protein